MAQQATIAFHPTRVCNFQRAVAIGDIPAADASEVALGRPGPSGCLLCWYISEKLKPVGELPAALAAVGNGPKPGGGAYRPGGPVCEAKPGSQWGSGPLVGSPLFGSLAQRGALSLFVSSLFVVLPMS